MPRRPAMGGNCAFRDLPEKRQLSGGKIRPCTAWHKGHCLVVMQFRGCVSSLGWRTYGSTLMSLVSDTPVLTKFRRLLIFSPIKRKDETIRAKFEISAVPSFHQYLMPHHQQKIPFDRPPSQRTGLSRWRNYNDNAPSIDPVSGVTAINFIFKCRHNMAKTCPFPEFIDRAERNRALFFSSAVKGRSVCADLALW